ncbi:unnamed protein product [Linum tenue]|uniref:Uncharacterized protein n=1 Tax=Linum tenue TaxID=586396 RepID=A0AAV0J214_9ROSI|nr:unnamed protein product [Linum tenue]
MSVQNIMEAVNHNNNQASTTKLPLEFQVSFNDQTNNDFNTLFRSLPAHRQQLLRRRRPRKLLRPPLPDVQPPFRVHLVFPPLDLQGSWRTNGAGRRDSINARDSMKMSRGPTRASSQETWRLSLTPELKNL